MLKVPYFHYRTWGLSFGILINVAWEVAMGMMSGKHDGY
jgi:hypothetical protein